MPAAKKIKSNKPQRRGDGEVCLRQRNATGNLTKEAKGICISQRLPVSAVIHFFATGKPGITATSKAAYFPLDLK